MCCYPALFFFRSGPQSGAALEHNGDCPQYNADLRQLIHVGYKVAAKIDAAYLSTVRANEKVIGARVTDNIYGRHMRRMFEDLSA